MKKVADIDKVDSVVQAELTDAAPLTKVDKYYYQVCNHTKELGGSLSLSLQS